MECSNLQSRQGNVKIMQKTTNVFSCKDNNRLEEITIKKDQDTYKYRKNKILILNFSQTFSQNKNFIHSHDLNSKTFLSTKSNNNTNLIKKYLGLPNCC